MIFNKSNKNVSQIFKANSPFISFKNDAIKPLQFTSRSTHFPNSMNLYHRYSKRFFCGENKANHSIQTIPMENEGKEILQEITTLKYEISEVNDKCNIMFDLLFAVLVLHFVLLLILLFANKK